MILAAKFFVVVTLAAVVWAVSGWLARTGDGVPGWVYVALVAWGLLNLRVAWRER